MKRVVSVVVILIVSGVLGGIASLELTGIGMCSVIPLTVRVAVQPFLVALLTVVLAWVLPVSWKVPAGIYTLPMLMPTLFSIATFFDGNPEMVRLVVSVSSIALCGKGCFALGRHFPASAEVGGWRR